MNETKELFCNLCDKVTVQKRIYPPVEMYRCMNCDLVTDTRRSIKEIYNIDYFSERLDEGWESSENEQFMTRLKQVQKFVQTGKLLEIGSAEGTFLHLASNEGFTVEGIELSEDAVQLCQEKYHIPVFIGTLEKAPLTLETFDCACAFHVLEHVKNPTDFMKRVASLLKPDGIIAIEVPNFGSLKSRIQKEKWWFIKPGEHLTHFTTDTLQKMFEKTGFDVVEKVCMGGLNLTGVSDDSHVGKQFLRQFIFKHIKIFSPLKAVVAKTVRKFGISENILIIGKKR